MTLLFLILSLGLVGISAFLLMSTLLYSSADEDVLAAASGLEQKKSTSGIINLSKPLVKSLTIPLALKVKNKGKRQSIETLIRTAGLSKELTADEYIGMQILWGVLFPAFLILMNFALNLGLSPIICIGIGFFGFFFPASHCKAKRTLRYNSIKSEFPFFIDLLALSIEAGMDFLGAIDRISEKLSENSELRKELEVVVKDVKLGSSRKEALQGLASRVDLDVMVSFCATIIDATETGVSVASVLKDQSEQMRAERFSEAEKKGATASQLILIPMVLFILPAIFLVIFSPMILTYFYKGGI